ncbi:glycosyltransferase family 4 protein [Massilia sp. AB1]|uniref:glycosyltransferase family 4 protein n=1 Tax=Massilia sp. AB1 TaxID=2823371 RepID=UPI001B82BA57|nr:glycosyltransferase family 4 protein [Massilia sp. AB1]MBQ5939632.1 glycosyltransferase family 4 protein [Massilia sp. AB1]
MKVLFQSRSTLFSVPGGDTVQLTKTAELLRTLGVTVDISTELEPKLDNYDLVHLFNLMRPQEVYMQAANAKRQGRRVALSTIYGLYTEYERKARPGLAGFVSRNVSPWQVERLKVVARVLANGEFGRGSLLVAGLGYKRLCGRVAALSDVFLPNSASEMGRVHSDFPQSRPKPFVVVPNAVDETVFDPAKVVVPESMRRFEGCVLSAARIEGRKCQLELVRAVKDLDVDLVLIGKPAPNHTAYYDAIKREATDRVHFVGQVQHAELAQYYAAAKVHALVSWMETPGLSSLEAGAMGCNLVITEKGDTRDYFGDEAHYCDPESVASIRQALVDALAAPPQPRLQERIRSEYTWHKAAEMTLKGYHLALES